MHDGERLRAVALDLGITRERALRLFEEGNCSLCAAAPATHRYGFPVCEACHGGLVSLGDDLEAMEAEDPGLAAAGERVEVAVERWLGPEPGVVPGTRQRGDL